MSESTQVGVTIDKKDELKVYLKFKLMMNLKLNVD